jgi:hypothetical protein
VFRDETSMPVHDRVGSDEKDRPPVTTNDARQGCQERTVDGFESGPWHLTVQDRELMSQYEDLGVFGAVASSAKYAEIQHQADKTVEGVGHMSILIDPSQADQIGTAKPQVNTPDEFSAPTRSEPRGSETR